MTGQGYYIKAESISFFLYCIVILYRHVISEVPEVIIGDVLSRTPEQPVS